MALSAKHRAFIEQYLLTSNATEAYDNVYHPKTRAVSASNGHKLLRNAEILEAISHRLSETAMLADEVLMRLASQARGSMNDFITFRDNGDPTFDFQTAAAFGKMGLVKKLKIKTRTYTTVEVAQAQTESEEIEGDDTAGDGAALGGVTETTVEFELYSSQAALELLGKHHRLFLDGPSGDENDPIYIKMDR